MSAEILVMLWYYWSAGVGLEPAARNTLGPDPDNRIIGADR